MISNAARQVRVVDQWTARTPDGSDVTYRILESLTAGFVYSADGKACSVSVTASQGPLTRDKIEALFADSVTGN